MIVRLLKVHPDPLAWHRQAHITIDHPNYNTSPYPQPIYTQAALSEIANMGGGGKIPYPKHIWSPAGGWYGQPQNWKTNTAVFGLIIAACAGLAWRVSAEREHRYRMPERDAFFPSRYWTKQIIEHDKAQKGQ
ncbi:hypothetical protein HRR81_000484 [Exophiala dermatitidis]|nr:hypothetical protein HRR81_000484 [Exophiala dermatitidis]